MLDKDLFDVGIYTLGAFLTYKYLLFGLGKFAGSKSKKINSQLELELMVDKNRKK